MGLSRRSFSVALAAAPFIATLPLDAEAKKSAKAPAKKAALPDTSVVHKCDKDEVAARAHGDVIADLITGEIIHLSDNLDKTKLDETVARSASITKLEGVKELYRRVASGLWHPSTEFNVVTGRGMKPRAYTLQDNVLMSLGPSLNVLDDIALSAGPDFIRSMNAHMREIGMMHSKYVSPTGNPDNPANYPDVRKEHVTTVGDLLRSIRDFELNYATPEATKKVFGLDRITGIWKIAVAGIHRNTHPIRILEDAEGLKTHPHKGVRSGKSGYTCASGFISYVRYDDEEAKRSFIVLTLGHPTAELRDTHTSDLIDTHLPEMRRFAREEAARQAIEDAAPKIKPDGPSPLPQPAALASETASAPAGAASAPFVALK